jgi:hypothetical protein
MISLSVLLVIISIFIMNYEPFFFLDLELANAKLILIKVDLCTLLLLDLDVNI